LYFIFGCDIDLEYSYLRCVLDRLGWDIYRIRSTIPWTFWLRRADQSNIGL